MVSSSAMPVHTVSSSLQADALIVDLYMGSANEAAGFRWTVGGFWGAVTDGQNDINGVAFNFTVLDQLAKGLHDAKVCNPVCPWQAGVKIEKVIIFSPHLINVELEN